MLGNTFFFYLRFNSLYRDEDGEDEESTRIDTKTIENLWTTLKHQLTAANVSKKNFNSYLQEGVARYNAKENFLEYFWNAVKIEYPFNEEKLLMNNEN